MGTLLRILAFAPKATSFISLATWAPASKLDVEPISSSSFTRDSRFGRHPGVERGSSSAAASGLSGHTPADDSRGTAS